MALAEYAKNKSRWTIFKIAYGCRWTIQHIVRLSDSYLCIVSSQTKRQPDCYVVGLQKCSDSYFFVFGSTVDTISATECNFFDTSVQLQDTNPQDCKHSSLSYCAASTTLWFTHVISCIFVYTSSLSQHHRLKEARSFLLSTLTSLVKYNLIGYLRSTL